MAAITVDPDNTVYDSRDNSNAIIDKASNTLLFGCKDTVIPETVMAIGPLAFYGNNDLTAITIPASVTSIGDEAFYTCSNLKTLILNDNLVSIGESVFHGCDQLENIVIYDSVTYIGEWAFTSGQLYCEATDKPAGWHEYWAISDSKVYWYSDTQNSDGRHWHYVEGVPTVWE